MPTVPSLKQLRYLVALDDTRHFRKAAERCGISQPSLSVQIANLEEILGLKLVSRGRGPVTPTVAGREVVRRARRIAEDVAALSDVASMLGAGLSGTVRLGVSTTLGPYFLPHVVGRLHRDHPDLRLHIREAAPRVLLEHLDRGTHDVLLTQLPITGADYSVARLFREPLLATVAIDHPLARKPEVTESDLAGHPMLSLGPAYALHEQVLSLCARVGAHVQHDYEGTSLDALRAMTAMGMGISLLPALYVASEVGPSNENSDVRAIPFKAARLTRSVGLVVRKTGGNERIMGRLTDVFREVARARADCGLRLES